MRETQETEGRDDAGLMLLSGDDLADRAANEGKPQESGRGQALAKGGSEG